MLVLLQLYRGADINMSQIAEYLNAPLNTTTGIVSRMEKKKMVQRIRNGNDKRVVTIMLTETGSKQINDIIGMFLTCGEKIISSLSADELGLVGKLISKVMTIVQETPLEEKPEDKKIRKITIE
jgi:DNA-binding MarR family transcriptional regulator